MAIETMTLLESGGDIIASEPEEEAAADMQVEPLPTRSTHHDAGTGGVAACNETQTTRVRGETQLSGAPRSTSSSAAGGLHGRPRLPERPAREDDERVLFL